MLANKKANYVSLDQEEASSDCHTDQTPSPAKTPLFQSRNIYDGNFSVYWILGLLSSSIFFAPFSFNRPLIEARERQPFGPFMTAHLYCCGIISFVCLWNIYHTPSHGPNYTVVHRWLGRIGLIASILGAAFALIATWFERVLPRLLFKSLLSILGIVQIGFTVLGYKAIRDAIHKRKVLEIIAKESARKNELTDATPSAQNNQELLEKEVQELIAKHKYYMAGLWACCLTPAFFRLPNVLCNISAGSYYNFLSYPMAILFFYAFLNATNHN